MAAPDAEAASVAPCAMAINMVMLEMGVRLEKSGATPKYRFLFGGFADLPRETLDVEEFRASYLDVESERIFQMVG